MGKRLQEKLDFPIEQEFGEPALDLPVSLDGRTYCGELDIRIDRAGTWFYNGTPINRHEMVCLFSSILARAEDGVYWLISPSEMGRIEVEDAPLLIIEMFSHGSGEDQVLSFCTNVDKLVTISEDTPILMQTSPATGEMTPYVILPDNIEARVERSVYYELVDRGEVMDLGDEEIFGVWSSGSFFPLGSLEETHRDTDA